MTAEKQPNRLEQALQAFKLDSLLAGFGRYRETLRRTLSYRGRLGARLFSADDPKMLATAFWVYLYGQALAFVIYAPLMVKHSLNLGKIYFLLQMLALTVVAVALGHSALKVVGGRGSIAQTAAVGLTYGGLIQPVVILLYYPVLYYLPLQDIIAHGRFGSEPMEAAIAGTATWVRLWHEVAVRLFFLLSFFLLAQWSADAHRIQRWRVLLSSALVLPPLIVIAGEVFYPRLSVVVRFLSDVLNRVAS